MFEKSIKEDDEFWNSIHYLLRSVYKNAPPNYNWVRLYHWPANPVVPEYLKVQYMRDEVAVHTFMEHFKDGEVSARQLVWMRTIVECGRCDEKAFTTYICPGWV